MIGIVVVTYNSAAVINDCLNACVQYAPEAKIVVVDNASIDETADLVKNWKSVTLIANTNNRGFAGGVNQGVAVLNCQAVLLLNPDAILAGSLDPLASAVAEDGVGAAAGRLLGEGDEDQHGFNVRSLPSGVTLVFEVLGINRLWPGNPVNRRYRQRTPEHRTDVEQPAGAFLMLRRDAWVQLGGFDESFHPVWFEDVDYCKRLRERGFRVIFDPACTARHSGGHSAGKLLWGNRQLFWYGSLLKYATKHFSGASRAAVCLAVVLGCIPRALVGMRHVGAVQAASVFGKVVCLTGQFLRKGERGSGTPAYSASVEEQLKQSR